MAKRAAVLGLLAALACAGGAAGAQEARPGPDLQSDEAPEAVDFLAAVHCAALSSLAMDLLPADARATEGKDYNDLLRARFFYPRWADQRAVERGDIKDIRPRFVPGKPVADAIAASRADFAAIAGAGEAPARRARLMAAHGSDLAVCLSNARNAPFIVTTGG
jgi:hypothetical protein